MDGRTLFHRFRYHLGSGFVEPEDIVLDLGCGTGYGSEILANKALEVWSYDMEQSNINAATEKHKPFNVNYCLGNIEQLDLHECEVACAFEVIEHLYDPKKFVDQLKAKTKKYIIASVPLDQKIIDVNGDPQEVGDKTHHSAFTQDEFMNLFLDEDWKEFYVLREGVTLITIFYNNKNI